MKEKKREMEKKEVRGKKIVSVVSKPTLQNTYVYKSGVIPTDTGLTLVTNSALEKMTLIHS